MPGVASAWPVRSSRLTGLRPRGGAQADARARDIPHLRTSDRQSRRDSKSSWFGEGLAVFYARRLACAFGQIAPGVSSTASIPRRALLHERHGRCPTAKCRRVLGGTRVRTLPYDRGSLYFAVVDDQMRKRSGGRRSSTICCRAGRAGACRADLLTMTGRRSSSSISASPPSPTFARCWQGGPAAGLGRVRNLLPAHDPPDAAIRTRLRAGSADRASADRARPSRWLGRRAGGPAGWRRDLRPVSQDAIQGDQTRRLRLELRRDGRTITLDYLPRGETVHAYQWARVEAVPDARCAI